GAHNGLYTLLSSTRVGNLGRVIAFEPSSRERGRLWWHIRLNHIRNVLVEAIALGEMDGESDLYIVIGRETGCNSLRPPAVGEPTRKVVVPVRSLDGYLEDNHV